MTNTTTHDIMLAQTEKAGQLLDYFQGHRDDLEARTAAKEAQVDAFVAGAERQLTMAAMFQFDPTVAHSKASLSAVEDPANTAQSKWIEMPPLAGTYIYASEGQHAVVYLAQSYAYAPGYYENPQYVNDKSTNRVEFVLAGYADTNEQINARLDELQVEPGGYAAWGTNAGAVTVPIISVPGAHGYKRLFARFRNHAYTAAAQVPDGTPPQPVLTHGGSCVFKLSEFRLFNY